MRSSDKENVNVNKGGAQDSFCILSAKQLGEWALPCQPCQVARCSRASEITALTDGRGTPLSCCVGDLPCALRPCRATRIRAGLIRNLLLREPAEVQQAPGAAGGAKMARSVGASGPDCAP